MRAGFVRKRLVGVLAFVLATVLAVISPPRAVAVDPGGTSTIAPPRKVRKVPPVVVTASKIEEKLPQVAASVTVITQEDIQRRQARTVREVLREVPGVDVQSSGNAPGSFTQVRIRGSNDNQVAVLVDGARVNDLFLGGGFDFGLMPLDNVERIEVVRGGASALYGSDAIGGVINIITKKGEGKPRLTVFSEGGSLHTFKEGASVSGSEKGTDFSLSYSRLDSAGLRPGPFNHNHDRENHFSARIGHDFGSATDPRARLQSIVNASTQDLQAPFDFPFGFDFSAVPPGLPPSFQTYDPNNVTERFFITTTNELTVKPTDWWETKFRFSLTQNHLQFRNDLDQGVPFPYLFREQNFGGFIFRPVTNFNRTRTADTTLEAEWIHHFTFEGDRWKNILTVGYLFERNHVSNRDFSTAGNFGALPPLYSRVDAERNRNAHFYQDHLSLWERVYLNAGFRVDQESQDADIIAPGALMETHTRTDSLYGNEVTPRFSAAIDIHEIGVKLHGAWSRNFHAPAFSDLFFPGFSNDKLQPEIGKSVEGGISFDYLEGKLGGDVTYYRTDFEDLIVFVTLAGPPFFTLDNEARAKAEGLEVSGYAGPWHGLRVTTSYTFLDTRGADGEPLQRRPRDKFNAGITYAKDRLSLHADFNYVSAARDTFDFVAADGGIRRGDVPRWHRVDLAATYDLFKDKGPFKNLQVYTRVDNLFNTSIEQVKGFPDPGTTAIGGIRGTF